MEAAEADAAERKVLRRKADPNHSFSPNPNTNPNPNPNPNPNQFPMLSGRGSLEWAKDVAGEALECIVPGFPTTRAPPSHGCDQLIFNDYHDAGCADADPRRPHAYTPRAYVP